MSRLQFLVLFALLSLAAGFTAGAGVVRRPLQAQQPAVTAMMPDPTAVSDMAMLLAKSEADMLLDDVMGLLGGPLAWGAGTIVRALTIKPRQGAASHRTRSIHIFSLTVCPRCPDQGRRQVKLFREQSNGCRRRGWELGCAVQVGAWAEGGISPPGLLVTCAAAGDVNEGVFGTRGPPLWDRAPVLGRSRVTAV